MREGRKVYNLSVGTPDFQPQQAIMDAVAEAARKPEIINMRCGIFRS